MMRVWLVLVIACSCSHERRAPVVEHCSDLPTCEAACTRGAIDDCNRAAERMQAAPDQTDATRYAAVLARSCEAGRAAACLSLVDVVLYAPSLPVNVARATELVRRACELGEGSACWNASRTREVETTQAAALLGRAKSLLETKCEAHDGNSCATLWAMYTIEAPNGDKPRSYGTRAADELERSCLAGAGPDCAAAAMILTSPLLHPDSERATRVLEHGCSIGNLDACRQVGTSAANRKTAKGRDALVKACDGGREDGCMALAAVTEDVATLQRGIKFARARCELGQERACDTLAKALNLHAMSAAEVATATDLIERVCRRGLPVLCHSLARALEAGTPSASDRARSASLEKLACDGGWQFACRAPAKAAGAAP